MTILLAIVHIAGGLVAIAVAIAMAVEAIANAWAACWCWHCFHIEALILIASLGAAGSLGIVGAWVFVQ